MANVLCLRHSQLQTSLRELCFCSRSAQWAGVATGAARGWAICISSCSCRPLSYVESSSNGCNGEYALIHFINISKAIILVLGIDAGTLEPTKLQLEIRESSLSSQDPATADVLQGFIDLSSSFPQNLTLEWLESRILDR